MKKYTLTLAMIGAAALLSGCVAVPVAEPTYGPPAAYVAPAPVVLRPYVYAHVGHYYRGPYYR